MTSDEFDWNDDESGDVLIQSQARTALYWNKWGDLVIRQDGHLQCCDDQIVVLRPQDALTVARAIIHEVEALGIQDQSTPTAKDRTAADRQRRRRAKQRDNDRDNDRDTVTVTPDELPFLTAAE
jgi:hypothetical protein